MPSKFSIAKPIGSIERWQPAHTGLARCFSIRSRSESTFPSEPASGKVGTLGGGGCGGTPSRFVRIHFPRSTGEVRFGYDVTVRMLA
jgi:hypothetical protein